MTTVYYAVHNSSNILFDEIFDYNPILNMLDSGLVPLYPDLSKDKSKSTPNSASVFSCRAFLDFTKNTYIMKNPIDLNVRVEKQKILNYGNRNLDSLYKIRSLQVENVYNFNYSLGYLFFSEDDIDVQVTSPFMHNSNFCKNGYIFPGKFNISKWFRSVNPALQFYDNSDKNIVSEKGDPLMYIKFNTEKNITLRKFFMCKELEDIMYATIQYKQYEPNRPLSYLYDKFEKAGLRKRTLKLIKENLI